MPVWTLSQRATGDLIAIRDYTIAIWDRTQAKTYLAGIRMAIDRVAGAPSLRRSCGDELPGYFRLVVGSHVVFYRESERTVHVERILHRRMDLESHL